MSHDPLRKIITKAEKLQFHFQRQKYRKDLD